MSQSKNAVSHAGSGVFFVQADRGGRQRGATGAFASGKLDRKYSLHGLFISQYVPDFTGKLEQVRSFL
jgi:hypothetical protein